MVWMKLTMRKIKFHEKTSGAQTITHDQDDIRRKAAMKEIICITISSTLITSLENDVSFLALGGARYSSARTGSDTVIHAQFDYHLNRCCIN